MTGAKDAASQHLWVGAQPGTPRPLQLVAARSAKQ